MTTIPLFIPVYEEPELLERLLVSVMNRGDLNPIYVMDTGPEMPEKERVYDTFDVQVVDIGPDESVSKARNKANEITDSEIYCLTDSDTEIVGDIQHLVDCIQSEDDVGAVTSPLIETDRILYMGGNFREQNGGLVREAIPKPDIRFIDGFPYYEYDLVCSSGVFRKECVDDYAWDEQYQIGFDHEDFHLGHWKNTKWNFLMSFMPVFKHNTGGRDTIEEKRENRNTTPQEQFLEKWGYDHWTTKSPWMSSDYEPRDDLERAIEHYRHGGVARVAKRALKKLL